MKRRNGTFRVKLICGADGVAKGLLPTRWPVPVRKKLRSTHRGSRRIEGGNTRKYRSESPEGLEVGQDDPRMSKTASITGRAGK